MTRPYNHLTTRTEFQALVDDRDLRIAAVLAVAERAQQKAGDESCRDHPARCAYAEMAARIRKASA